MFIVGNSQSPLCYSENECVSENIFVSGGTWARCYGYNSCLKATITAIDGSPTFCFGSYSCYQATKIWHINTTGVTGSNMNSISCRGLYSCANVNSIYQEFGNIDCLAEFACFQSGITIGNGVLNCKSDRGCSSSFIISNHDDTNIYLDGHLSGYNTTFTSNYNVSYYFRGTQSGKNATIFCGDGNKCYIECWGNACDEITLLCNSTNDNRCIFDINCQFSRRLYSTCDDGADACSCVGSYINTNITGESYMIDKDLILPNILEIPLSTLNNSINPCNFNVTNAINCTDTHECENDILDTRTRINDYYNGYGGGSLMGTPVCCLSNKACRFSKNITTLLPLNSSIIISIDRYLESTAIRCDGYWSCYQTVGNIIAQNGGNIYFTGTYTGQIAGIVSTTIDYDIICTGFQSCDSINLISGRNVYCNGHGSCRNSAISGIDNNIYFYGCNSGENSILNDIGGSVYCGTSSVCTNDNISNINGDVYAWGYRALQNATIINVGNNIVGYGIESLQNTRIDNASTVKYSKLWGVRAIDQSSMIPYAFMFDVVFVVPFFLWFVLLFVCFVCIRSMCFEFVNSLFVLVRKVVVTH